MKPHPRLGYGLLPILLVWEVIKLPYYIYKRLFVKKPIAPIYPTDAEIKARRLEAKKSNKNNKNN